MLDNNTLKLLSQDQYLGAGNFIKIALECVPDPTYPFFSVLDNDRHHWPQLPSLMSVLDLYTLSRVISVFFQDMDVHAGDRIAICLSSGIEYYFLGMSLTAIGAIPVFINGNLPIDIVSKFITHVEAKMVVIEADQANRLAGDVAERATIVDIETIRKVDLNAIPTEVNGVVPYIHDENDIVLICHSSGTTGFPKPVKYCHKNMCFGIKQFLNSPPEFVSSKNKFGETKILSLLPKAHHSSFTYFIRAVLAQIQFCTLCDATPNEVASLISQFKPTAVVAFPHSYVALSELDIADSQYSFDSISWWLSVGDVAHHRHIYKLISHGHSASGDEFSKGSTFIDGLGSSEMGSIFFRALHRHDHKLPLRSIGYPQEWVTAKIFTEDGLDAPPLTVGRLGVRAPTLATYWNKNDMDDISWIGDFFLTGDLAYRNVDGMYFHVDRSGDAVLTKTGMLYSTLAEELILDGIPSINECAIVAERFSNDATTSTAVCFACCKNPSDIVEEALKNAINGVLLNHAIPSIDKLFICEIGELPKGPTGKIRKVQLRTRIFDTALITTSE